ncbi:MAG: aldose epimerase [Demequinaceae bacterium]|nr:aldose epimerase [Demequinaceae bacterium]
MIEPLTIVNGHWRVGLLPDNGGCVAFGQARVGDAWVDILRPTPADRLGERWDTASFPLIPWSNRIRRGTLLWEGMAYRLRRWGTEDFAMHGTAVEFPWAVVEKGTDHATLRFDSRAYHGVNFPWGFVARTEFVLDGPRFTWAIEIENVDEEPFPAGFGHHPYFVRRLASEDGTPVGEEALLQVNCERAYLLDNGMAGGPAGPVPSVEDFRALRPLGTDFVDTCQTARSSPIAATIEYPGAAALDLEADDLLSHLVVYLPVGETFFAVEPVTNANDAFTLHALGVPGTGVLTIDPGKAVSAEFSLVLR